MINLRRIASSCMAIALGSFIMFSCAQDELENTPTNEIPEEIATGVAELGFDANSLRKITTYENPITKEGPSAGYVFENDIIVPEIQLLEMINSGLGEIVQNAQVEQYRTNNLVSFANRNISVVGFTGSGFALTSRMRTGLRRAVSNFNRLNINLNFTLRFAASTDADMVVFNNGAAGGGGSAGFPSGGQPNKFIQINAGTNSFSADVNEHVITHEMGHSIGFRHTDFFNRSLSCGTGGNEGAGTIGAILIPGTPSGTDTNSIMQSCFGGDEDGEFGPLDIVALEFLY